MADPKFGLALGGGAARGLSHISVLEALDEYGIVPARIAGTSIGALFGAARASGITGAEIRHYALETTSSVRSMLNRLLRASRPHTIKEMFAEGLSVQLDSRDVVQAFIPGNLAKSFEAMAIPFAAVATDYYGWRQKVFSSGELLPALAASIAVPSFFQPVEIDGRTYVDGNVINPVPFGEAAKGMDYLIGVDVTGVPTPLPDNGELSAVDVAFGAAQIMQNAIISNNMALHTPHIFVKPSLSGFRAHEFFRAKEILAAGDREKDDIKRHLDQLLG